MIQFCQMRVLLALSLLPALAGCVAMGDVRPYQPLPPMDVVVAAPVPASAGAIYQANTGLSLFADGKARNVGDILTINLLENTIAQSSADTTVNKNSSVEVEAPMLFGHADPKKQLSATVSGKRGFTGNGKSAQSNRLQGQVTVTVIQRLPNGNLVVAGEKNLRLNQSNELVQIQGIVRAADIAADNTIASSKVANAQIVYGGRGAMAQANAMGWLARFFNSRLMPY